MTREEFDGKIAQINQMLASTASKLKEAFELDLALDAKLDRLKKKIDKPVDVSESTNRKPEL